MALQLHQVWWQWCASAAWTHSCPGVDPAQSVPQLALDHKPQPFLDAIVPVEVGRQTWAQACPEMGLSHFIQVPAYRET